MPITSKEAPDVAVTTISGSPMRALIDGDPLVYRAAWACQKTKYMVVNLLEGEEIQKYDTKAQMIKEHGKDIPEIANLDTTPLTDIEDPYEVLRDGNPFCFYRYEEFSPESHMKHTIKCMIQDIITATNAGEYTLYLTGKGNFRESEATLKQYKGNRMGKSKPVLYQAAREYMEQSFAAEVITGMEADDALSIAHYQEWKRCRGSRNDSETVMVTIDKDLRQIPGWFYDLNAYASETKPEDREPVWITELGEVKATAKKAVISGLRGFYAQMLLGDVCDHIPGVKGYGPIKAAKIVNACNTEEELYNAILEVYRKAYGDTYTYYPWTEYVDPNVKKSELVLKDGAKSVSISCEDVLNEVAGLLYMLRSPDDKWAPPIQKETVPMTDQVSNQEQDAKPANGAIIALVEIQALLDVLGELPTKVGLGPVNMLNAIVQDRGVYLTQFDQESGQDVEGSEGQAEETEEDPTPKKKPKTKKAARAPKKAVKSKSAKVQPKNESVFDENDDYDADEE